MDPRVLTTHQPVVAAPIGSGPTFLKSLSTWVKRGSAAWQRRRAPLTNGLLLTPLKTSTSPAYQTVVFTTEFMQSLTRLSSAEQRRILRALELPDTNERHPSLNTIN